MKRLIVLTVAMGVLWAGAAAAQMTRVLVSDDGQTQDGSQELGVVDSAQPFTTGSGTAGFTITAVTIETKGHANHTFALAVCTVQDVGTVTDVPTTDCTMFTAPTDFTTLGTKTFTHSGMTVTANTTYAVKMSVTSGIPASNRPALDTTTDDGEDNAGLSDWTIHNEHRWFDSGTDMAWKTDGGGKTFTLKIEGFINTFPTANTIAVTSSPQRWRIPTNSDTAVNDVYGAGEEMEFTVTFSKAVTVTGTPRLSLLSTRYADYHSGSGTSTLTFTYTVQAGDTDADGINLVANALELNSGTIVATDDGTTAIITHDMVGNQSDHQVDGSRTGPWVRSLAVTSTPGDEGYGGGETIEFTATFSEAVTVTGAPELGFNIGTVAHQAAYSAADSSGTKLVLLYTVMATDLDTDGLFILDLALNGGTIKAGGVDAELINPGRGPQPAHTVNGQHRPTVSSLMAERMGEGVTLSWAASDADATITGYEYRYARTESELDTKPYTALGRGTNSVRITNFPIYGRLYYFDVRPRSNQGPLGTRRVTDTPQRRTPSAVRYLQVTPKQTSLELEWLPPESPGYEVISRYEYRYAQGSTVPNETAWTAVPDYPATRVTIITNPAPEESPETMPARLYTVEVRAINGDTAPNNEGMVAKATVMEDKQSPELVRATVDGTMLALDYNEDLEPSVVASDSFAGSSVTVSTTDGGRVTGARVILTLDPAVMAGDTVTLDYTGSGGISDVAQNPAAAFDDHPVRNVTGQGVLDVTPPELVAAEVAGYTLVATWNEALDPQWAPLPTNFAVIQSNPTTLPVGVDRVQLCGTKVTLTLAEFFAESFDGRVSLQYVHAGRGLRDRAGNRIETSPGSEPVTLAPSVAGCSGTSPGGGGGGSGGGGSGGGGGGSGGGGSGGGRGGGGGGGGSAITEEEPALIGTLENPGPGSRQSGLGLLSGWVCDAERVEVEINGEARIAAAYGTARADTVGECGDADTGFGLLFNWNLVGDGPQTVVALADGVAFAQATFTVTTLGEEFVRDAGGETVLTDFPTAGAEVRLVWQEATQNFVLAPLDGGPPPASPPSPAGGPTGVLENPGPASFQSGLGLVSGWVCEAEVVEVAINGGPRITAAYGTARADTAAVCGDAATGFGLLFNWNLLDDGVHTVVALADGVEFGRATFTVTTLGEEFVQGARGETVLDAFPAPGEAVRLIWQEANQNFVLAPLP